MAALDLKFPNGHTVFIYPKGDDHRAGDVHDPEHRGRRHRRLPSTTLVAKGVTFERYPEMTGQDERGIVRDEGPPIASFRGSRPATSCR